MDVMHQNQYMIVEECYLCKGELLMGFLSNIFRSRHGPMNKLIGGNYSFYMGNSTAGKHVTERSAMQMTAVYSCVRILAEAVAGLPLHVYKYNDEGGKEKAINHPLYHLLHDEPNKEMSSFVFRETLMTHLLLWGNAYAQIIRNGKGPKAIVSLCGNSLEYLIDRYIEAGLFEYQKGRKGSYCCGTEKDQGRQQEKHSRIHG